MPADVTEGRSTDWLQIAQRFVDQNPAYEICDSATRKPVEVDSPCLPLGAGGSGVVFLARYKEGLLRAVKILAPTDKLTQKQGLTPFRESFLSERLIMSQVRHENLPTLIDYGTLQNGDNEPFIITQYIEGDELPDYLESHSLSESHGIRILRQVLAGMSHMHSKSLMHCDVKPTNVRIRHESLEDSNAVLVDLGGAKLIPEVGPDFGNKDRTVLYSTKSSTLPELVNLLGNDGQTIAWGLVRDSFPAQDLYGFSTLVELMLDTQRFPLQTNQAMAVIRDRLKAREYESASQVSEALARLISSQSMQIPEMATGAAAVKSIATPDGRVGVDGFLDDLLDHPLLQRLRLVPQTDLLTYVFPGASNTRFLHTLHAIDLARAAVSRLSGDAVLRLDMTRELSREFLLRAATVNLGQYQLSHAFEDLIEDRDARVKGGLASPDELARNTLLAKGPWAGHTDERGRSVADILEGIAINELLPSAGESGTTYPDAAHSLLAGLLDSGVDVSKLAYLADDSHFSGLRFGRAVDPIEIFGGICAEPLEGRGAYEGVVCLRERAISQAAAAVVGRYWQTQKLYWHKKNRSLLAMVRFLILELIRADRFSFDEYLAATVMSEPWESIRWIVSRFEGSNSEVETINPLRGYLQGQRVIHTRLLTLSPESAGRDIYVDGRIYSKIRSWPSLTLIDLEDEIREEIMLRFGGSLARGELLIDTPRRDRANIGRKVKIVSDDRQQVLGELSKFSSLARSLQAEYDLFAQRARIFVAPDVPDRLGVEKSVLRQGVHAFLQERLQ